MPQLDEPRSSRPSSRDLWLDVRRSVLDPGRSPTAVAEALGLDPSTFAEDFEARFFLPPEAFRELRGKTRFSLRRPAWLRWDRLQAYWGRDPSSLSERVEGDTISWSTVSAAGALRIDAVPLDSKIEIRVQGPSDPHLGAVAHDLVLRCLGLHLDPHPFEQICDGYPDLVAGRRGTTLPQTPSVFDAALWVIAGQQVSLSAAFSIRRRLTEAFGETIDGLRCSPAPDLVAATDVETLHGCGLTRRKAEYLKGIAERAGVDPHGLLVGERPGLEGWRRLGLESAEKLLLDIRGYGAWSAGYMLMRGLGFADAVPYGDVALQKALRRYFKLEKRPGREQTEELMAPFRPFRSLATFHFWAWSATQDG